MIEFTGGKKGTRIYVPNSGPGSKWIIAGDTEVGYFGEVSPSLLFTESELSEAVGLGRGVPLEENVGWLKFAYNGKILFIAKRPLRNLLSWTDLYQAGLVYGVGDNGEQPNPVDQPVHQLKVVKKNLDYMRVRLMTGTTGVITVPGGEWQDLLLRTSVNDPTKDPWEKFSNLDLKIDSVPRDGTATLIKERDANARTRGYALAVPVLSKTLTAYTSDIGWRPVLELIRGEQPLYKVYGLGYLTSGLILSEIGGVSLSHENIRPVTDIIYDAGSETVSWKISVTGATFEETV